MDDNPEAIQSQIDMLTAMIDTCAPGDPNGPWWENTRQQYRSKLEAYHQLTDSATAMFTVQPSWNGIGESSTAMRGNAQSSWQGNGESLMGGIHQPSWQGNDHTSPASAASSAPSSNKRSFGLSADGDGRETKRVSANQSPLTPGTPNSQFGAPFQQQQFQQQPQQNQPLQQWTLPKRSGEASHHAAWPFVDLTVSDSPSPEPFPELINAFSVDGARPMPADAFDQDFMPENELAQFLINPTPANDGFGSQQQPRPQPQLRFDFASRGVRRLPEPEMPHWYRRDSEEDDDQYGDFPLNATEVESIEKMLEIVEQNGNDSVDDREQTPRIMSSTLKEYQKIGLTWLLKMEAGHNKGGILADEMGLGKTVSSIWNEAVLKL
jgi:hypothetical protein